MTIVESLQALQKAKTDIATEIVNKGGNVAEGDGFADFPADIKTIPTGGGTGDTFVAATEAEMDSYLTEANLDKVVHYTGEDGKYKHDAYYKITESASGALEYTELGGGGGISLDPLDNPATEADVLTDKEYYDDQGVKHVGTANFSEGLKPQLNAPTITKSGDSLSISNPSTNGNFMKTLKVYADETVVQDTSSSSFNLLSLENGTYTMSAVATGENFKESPRSNTIEVTVMGIQYDLTNITSSISTARITSERTLSFKLTPASGYYLPEFISISVNGEELDYTYDSYTGQVSVSALKIIYEKGSGDGSKLFTPQIELDDYLLVIDNVPHAEQYELTSDGEFVTDIPAATPPYYTIVIKATALDTPKLRTPQISLTDNILFVEDVPNAQEIELYVDGVLRETKPIGG